MIRCVGRDRFSHKKLSSVFISVHSILTCETVNFGMSTDTLSIFFHLTSLTFAVFWFSLHAASSRSKRLSSSLNSVCRNSQATGDLWFSPPFKIISFIFFVVWNVNHTFSVKTKLMFNCNDFANFTSMLIKWNNPT